MYLKDKLNFRNGKGLKNLSDNGLYPVYGSTGIIGKTNDILLDNDSLIIGRVGANCGVIQLGRGPCWITDNCIIATPQNSSIKFVYYLLQTMNIHQYHIGSAQPLLTSEILKTLKIEKDYSIDEQQHIVNINRHCLIFPLVLHQFLYL